jgi:protein-disulfide isomerase
LKPSGQDTVSSTGAVCENDGGTESEEVLDVQDWYWGPKARANETWITMIKNKTQEDIEGVDQRGIRFGEAYLPIYRIVTNSVMR